MRVRPCKRFHRRAQDQRGGVGNGRKGTAIVTWISHIKGDYRYHRTRLERLYKDVKAPFKVSLVYKTHLSEDLLLIWSKLYRGSSCGNSAMHSPFLLCLLLVGRAWVGFLASKLFSEKRISRLLLGPQTQRPNLSVCLLQRLTSVVIYALYVPQCLLSYA